MNIYLVHATTYPDYQHALYVALRASALGTQHTFVLPHEKSAMPIKSKDIIAETDVIVAEVSYPSTGMGIELGWSEMLKKKIVCLFRTRSRPSSSLGLITSCAGHGANVGGESPLWADSNWSTSREQGCPS